MNAVDIALVVLLAVCAARGFWRGFIREVCGFLAFVVGLGAALQYTEAGATMLERVVDLPMASRTAIAFIAIFMLVHTAGNVIGFLLDRLLGSGASRSVGRIGGALFGIGKATAVVAFVLLFLDVFPMVPFVKDQIRESRIARPLVSAAANVLRAGMRETAGRRDSAHVWG